MAEQANISWARNKTKITKLSKLSCDYKDSHGKVKFFSPERVRSGQPQMSRSRELLRILANHRLRAPSATRRLSPSIRKRICFLYKKIHFCGVFFEKCAFLPRNARVLTSRLPILLENCAVLEKNCAILLSFCANLSLNHVVFLKYCALLPQNCAILNSDLRVRVATDSCRTRTPPAKLAPRRHTKRPRSTVNKGHSHYSEMRTAVGRRPANGFTAAGSR